MGEKLAYWGSTLFSAIALILVVATISLANSNRALQAEVSQRQNQINAGQTYDQLTRNLIQSLAGAAIKNNDAKLRDLLASQGVQIKEPPASSPDTAEKKK